ncbi:MAG: hypothetical protein LBU86_01040, partial [Oscillospiraceae bacterium]|nr:hypothetical protein [Oscillospiraceae bacterium]
MGNGIRSAMRLITTAVLLAAFTLGGATGALATELDPFRAWGEGPRHGDYGFYAEGRENRRYGREEKNEILEVELLGYRPSGGLAFRVRGADSKE